MKKNAVPLAVLTILLILGLLLGLWADRHPYPKSAEDVNKKNVEVKPYFGCLVALATDFSRQLGAVQALGKPDRIRVTLPRSIACNFSRNFLSRVSGESQRLSSKMPPRWM
jgi:hypothetical protein